MTIEPTAVYSPGTSPASGYYQGGVPGGGQNWRFINNGGPMPQQPGFAQRTWNRIPQQNPQATLPGNLPGFLRNGAMNNRAIVFNTWVIAMILIGFDEWHNLGILPRPARLWDATLVYGVLVMLGFIDPLVPLANALAIGYTFMLLFQYYQGNITPAGATNNSNDTTQGTGTPQQGFTGPPPTPGANFPINSQLTGQ